MYKKYDAKHCHSTGGDCFKWLQNHLHMYWLQIEYDENDKHIYTKYDPVPCTEEMIPGDYKSKKILNLCPPVDKLNFLNSKQ